MTFSSWIAEHKIPVIMLATYIVFVLTVNIANLAAPNKETSDKYYTIITPPGWAFAIWGLIFVCQAVCLVAALVPATSRPFAEVFDAPIAAFWAATVFLQALWSVVVSSTVDFAGVLLVLSVITTISQQIYSLRRISAIEASRKHALLLYVICVVPFSIHAGWTAAAAGLNVNLSAIKHETMPTGQLALAIGTLLWLFTAAWTFGIFGTPLSVRASDPAFAGALIWALYAISAHSTTRPTTAIEAVVTFLEGSIVPDALSRSATFAASVLVVAVFVRGAIDSIRMLRAKPIFAPIKGSQPLNA